MGMLVRAVCRGMKANECDRWLESMGLEIVWESCDVFQPDNEKCVPEVQQYIIAKRKGEIRPAVPAPE
jgi:hypothetical protein